MSRRRTSKSERALLWLLAVVIAMSLIAIVMMLLSSRESSAETVLLELITFSISIAAITLSILSGINSIRQTRAIRRIARDVRSSVNRLEEIGHANASIQRRIAQDYKLARDMAEGLTEAGLLSDETDEKPATVTKKTSRPKKHST